MLQKRHMEHVFIYGQSFIVSHSRVALVKMVTLPRLEVSGAVPLAELTDKILLVLNVEISSIHLWPNSTIFLYGFLHLL
jgi:hypothetical protein